MPEIRRHILPCTFKASAVKRRHIESFDSHVLQSESLIPSLQPPDDVHIIFETLYPLLCPKNVDENALPYLSMQLLLPFQHGSHFSFLSSSNQLTPSVMFHPSRVFSDSVLLHRNPACFSTDFADLSQATVCRSCLSSLGPHKLPPL